MPTRTSQEVPATEVMQKRILGIDVATLVWVIATTITGCGAWYGLQQKVSAQDQSIAEEARERARADAEQIRENERIRAELVAQLARMEKSLDRIETKVDQKADRDEVRKRTP